MDSLLSKLFFSLCVIIAFDFWCGRNIGLDNKSFYFILNCHLIIKRRGLCSL